MTTHSKQNSLTSIYYKIDKSLSKFYSSRPQTVDQSGICSCKRRQQQKQQEMNFYTSHKEMITQAADNLIQSSRTGDQVIIGKILLMVVDYINKILQLLDLEILCQCKKSIINQSVIAKYKLQFMRQQNDKFFKLFQQKNLQCENLNSKLKQITTSREDDVIPLSARGIDQKSNRKQNKKSAVFLIKSDVSAQSSAKSSKISDICQVPRAEIKDTIQRDHNLYFNLQMSKKQRKSKIFRQIY